MPNTEEKYEKVLFMKPTTFLESYQRPELRDPDKTTFRARRKKPRPDYVPIKDLHALTPYKDPNVPFNLFHKPDPITRRDPRLMQGPYEELKDEDRAKVQKSRPKVVGKGPALDLDACDEPYRQMIIDDIYSTTTKRAQMEAVAGASLNNVKAPLPNAYSKCRPVSIKPVTEPYVSPEWRKDTVSWDDRQLRAHNLPTKTFWLTREKEKHFCSVCEDTAMRTAMNKTRN